MNIYPDVLIELIVLFCGEEEIIMFQNKLPILLGYIDVDYKNIHKITIVNVCYIKKLRAPMSLRDADLKYFTKLQYFNCSENTNLTETCLEYLPNLHTLICNDTRIKNRGLKNLRNLQVLDCRGNKFLTDDGLKYLPNLAALECLYNNNLTDECLKFLPKLRYLNNYGAKAFVNVDLSKYDKMYKQKRPDWLCPLLYEHMGHY